MYYSDRDYIISKKDGWFLIIPTSVNSKLQYVDYINNMSIFNLNRMSKKDILYYFEEINKIVKEIKALGLQNVSEIDLEELKKSEQNNDSKKFSDILNKCKEQVKSINLGLNDCNNKNATINKMFDIVISHITDEDFLKWIKMNYNLCYSCESFAQVERIYEEQKNKVKETIMNKEEDKNVNLNEVDSMPQDIEKMSDDPTLPKQQTQSNMTLEEVGLKPKDEDVNLNESNDTFNMNVNPSYDNNNITINTGNTYQQEDSMELERENTKIRRLVPPQNNSAAFTNWYGIILTLIFSFAIGYLIAWIIFNIR